jgi:hypothetical protein
MEIGKLFQELQSTLNGDLQVKQDKNVDKDKDNLNQDLKED